MLVLRRYRDSDRGEVRALHHLALESVGDVGSGPWDSDLDRIEEEYLDAGGEFLVGTHEDRIVAMGALRRTSAERAEIKRMRVHPHFQRRGFGQMVLDALEARAGELGYAHLHLDTTAQQVAAQNFYKKNGYVEVARAKLSLFEVIHYAKRLTPREEQASR